MDNSKEKWSIRRIDYYGDYALQYSLLAHMFCIWLGVNLISSFHDDKYQDAVREIQRLSGRQSPNALNKMFANIPILNINLDNVYVAPGVTGEDMGDSGGMTMGEDMDLGMSDSGSIGIGKDVGLGASDSGSIGTGKDMDLEIDNSGDAGT